MRIEIKRVYEAAASDDGYRVLVDRLWPRGVSKERAAIDLWAKELTPSTELRKWFGHDPEKWDEFQKRYRAELAAHKEALDELRATLQEHDAVTFVYGAKATNYSHALVLRAVLLEG